MASRFSISEAGHLGARTIGRHQSMTLPLTGFENHAWYWVTDQRITRNSRGDYAKFTRAFPQKTMVCVVTWRGQHAKTTYDDVARRRRETTTYDDGEERRRTTTRYKIWRRNATTTTKWNVDEEATHDTKRDDNARRRRTMTSRDDDRQRMTATTTTNSSRKLLQSQ